MVLVTSQQEFSDADFRVVATGDQSKKLKLLLSGLTTGTTRVLTIPDADGTIMLTSATLVAGDLLYSTGAATLARLAKGTALQQLRMNAGATAPEWFTPSATGIASYQTAQPTSDVAEVVFTGLSSCRVVTLGGAFTQAGSNSRTYKIQGRTSGGTWRDATGNFTSAAVNNKQAFSVTVFGFNASQDIKHAIGTWCESSVVLDASDAANSIANASTNGSIAGAASWDEVWDEIKIICSAASIEGSAANERGWFTCMGFT